MPLLSRRLARLSDFNILLREIRSALDKGYVRDHASPALQQIRQRLQRVRERVHRTLHDFMTTYSSVVQDPVVTIRNERFVVPLKTDFRQALRGIVHGESSSGATVYVEAEGAVELNNQLFHIQAEEAAKCAPSCGSSPSGSPRECGAGTGVGAAGRGRLHRRQGPPEPADAGHRPPRHGLSSACSGRAIRSCQRRCRSMSPWDQTAAPW